MSLSNGVVYSAPPPDGYIPDFTRPYEATGLIVCIGVFLPLAVISMVIRMYTRTRIVGNIALDDYVMLVALLLSVVLTGFILNMLNYGLGKHLYDVPLNWLYPDFLFNNLLAAIIFCAATGFAKTSILLFYSRIFPSRIFKIVIWSFVAFTIGYSASSVFVNIFSCAPIGKSWQLKYATTGSCINRPIFYFAQAGLGIFTDFGTLVAPLPAMWKLQLPLRQKIGIAVILMTGGFVCIVSIIRLQSIYVLLKATDLTVATPPALMWCVIELNMSIVGGSVPTFKPFIRKFMPSLLGSSSDNNYAYGSNGVSANRNRSGSHQLKSFDPVQGNGAKGFTKTTVTGIESNGLGKHYGDNESEEYIIQTSAANSDRDLERSATSGPIKGYGNITRTVEFGYKEHDSNA